jgi:hypothetical protein
MVHKFSGPLDPYEALVKWCEALWLCDGSPGMSHVQPLSEVTVVRAWQWVLSFCPRPNAEISDFPRRSAGDRWPGMLLPSASVTLGTLTSSRTASTRLRPGRSSPSTYVVSSRWNPCPNARVRGASDLPRRTPRRRGAVSDLTLTGPAKDVPISRFEADQVVSTGLIRGRVQVAAADELRARSGW